MANQAQLQELTPNATITKEVVDLQMQCAICCVEFILNESGVRKLQCKHLFHTECLFPWLQQNASCPVCRAKLPNVYQNRSSRTEMMATVLSAVRHELFTMIEELSVRDRSESVNAMILELRCIRQASLRPSNRTRTTTTRSRVSPIRESTYAADEVRVSRRRAALRARSAIARVYCRR